MTEMVVTTGAISRAKLQSNRHHQQKCYVCLMRSVGWDQCVYVIKNDVVLENVAVMLTAVLTVKMLQYCHGDCEK